MCFLENRKKCSSWLGLKSPELSLLQAWLDLGLLWYHWDLVTVHALLLSSFVLTPVSATCDSSCPKPHNCLRFQGQWLKIGVIFPEVQRKSCYKPWLGHMTTLHQSQGCSGLMDIALGHMTTPEVVGRGYSGSLSWFHRNHNSLRVGEDDLKEEIRTHLIDRVSELPGSKINRCLLQLDCCHFILAMLGKSQ